MQRLVLNTQRHNRRPLRFSAAPQHPYPRNQNADNVVQLGNRESLRQRSVRQRHAGCEAGSHSQRNHLAREFAPATMRAEFGLLPVDGQDRHGGPARAFYVSRAWAGLVQWVGEHPRMAKRMSRYDAYLPGWYDHARRARSGPAPSSAASPS